MQALIDPPTPSEAAAAPAPHLHANAIQLLRTMQQHHVTLSTMADHKANIIIGINSVIFALIIRDAPSHPALMLLAASSGIAAVLCLLVVVPSLGSSRLFPPGTPPNLLFFSGFTRLPEAEWVAWLQSVNADEHAIQRAMARDVYQMGQVLARKKYRFLTWGYRVFIGGLIASIALLLVQFIAGIAVR